MRIRPRLNNLNKREFAAWVLVAVLLWILILQTAVLQQYKGVLAESARLRAKCAQVEKDLNRCTDKFEIHLDTVDHTAAAVIVEILDEVESRLDQ
jgi:hypothetical protein